MSILIRSVEMPKSCIKCPFCYMAYGHEPNCRLDSLPETEECYLPHMEEDPGKTRHPNCPLVSVPTPHGRLIDADALMENAQYKGKHDIVTAYDIVAAQTIIESEG